MRGTDEASGSLFSYVNLEARHSVRKIRQVVSAALASLDAEFDGVKPISAAHRSRRSG